MKISDTIINEIRVANDIVDIISEHVHLKKRGKNYLGLCPFHTEKTPSFTVSAEKQIYYCFGCHKGGDVFSFIKEIEKITFIEAVKELASKANIVLPTDNIQSDKMQSEYENYYSVCRFAVTHFYKNLTETEEGKFALNYFHQRGFTDETINLFGLGYSINSWNTLVNKAIEEGFTKEDLVKVGLARKKDDGSIYDYFRGRAMFPIFSTIGRVIGFGARKIREDDTIDGKYLNSPETPIYNKSAVLYGLYNAKDYIRREDDVILVEGYADTISLFQAGIKNVVASSGTALTNEQLVLISRYTKNLTLVYDADTAGLSATVRGIDLALENDLNVHIVELPQGEDPDSFVKKNGGSEFKKILKNSISFIEYKASEFKRNGAFETPEKSTQAVRAIVQSIAKIKDELKREFFIKEIASKFNIYDSILYRELSNIINKDKRTTIFKGVNARRAQEKESRPPDVINKSINNPIPAEERDILKLLIEGNKDVINFILTQISVTQFSGEVSKKLAQLILDIYDVHGIISAPNLISLIDDEEQKNLITNLALSKYELSKGWQEMEKEIDEPDPIKIAKDAIYIIRKKEIKHAMDENQKKLKEAALQNIDTTTFLKRQQELLTSLKQLETIRTN